MAARLEHKRVSVSSLCIAAAVPATTALRWIKSMTDEGLFVRRADNNDGRRIFIELSDEAAGRSEEHTSELQSLMRLSYAVFCLQKTILPSHILYPHSARLSSPTSLTLSFPSLP